MFFVFARVWHRWLLLRSNMWPCLYVAVSSMAKSVESVVCIFIILRISISMTSTLFSQCSHVSNPVQWTCSPLIPAVTVRDRQKCLQTGSCRGGEVFCFECHCDSFGFFLSLFLHVHVCVLQSHCPVDNCVTALFLTQRWASTCGPRIWISVSSFGNCGGSRGSRYYQSAELKKAETGIIYSQLSWLKWTLVHCCSTSVHREIHGYLYTNSGITRQLQLIKFICYLNQILKIDCLHCYVQVIRLDLCVLMLSS